MAKKDIVTHSLDEIKAMRARGEVRKTPDDAPTYEPDEYFWANAKIVSTGARPKSKASPNNSEDDIVIYSLDDIKAMDARGEIRETPDDAPTYEPDEHFWANAKIVATGEYLIPRHNIVDVPPDLASWFWGKATDDVSFQASITKALRTYVAEHQTV